MKKGFLIQDWCKVTYRKSHDFHRNSLRSRCHYHRSTILGCI